MVLRFLGFFVLGFGLLACSNHSTQEDETALSTTPDKPISLEDAKNLYAMNCISCHGKDGKLQVANAKDLSISTLNSAEIQKMIEKGSDKGMAPFEQMFSKPQIAGLVEYVQTLRK